MLVLMLVNACVADDTAPAARKSQWLAVFYLCQPTGYALGYIYGGLVAQVNTNSILRSRSQIGLSHCIMVFLGYLPACLPACNDFIHTHFELPIGWALKACY